MFDAASDSAQGALSAAVQAAFASGGPIARVSPHFRARSGQIKMAHCVAQTIENDGVLVIEAGTGVGKTFAYLTPVLLSGEKALISTATKNLQDQLFSRDLPHLSAALGFQVRSALLKGRSSYVCLHRLSGARHDISLRDTVSHATLAKIERWAQQTSTGDLGELPGLHEGSPIIPAITSTRENCLGSDCPQYRACHVQLARKEALAADVVVVNHHLFFADLLVRESGMAELLPTVRIHVFDEAHQLNETGIQFLGAQLSTGQIVDLARDLLATGLQLARGLADWQMHAAALEKAGRDLRLCVGWASPPSRQKADAQPARAYTASAGQRLAWNAFAPDGVAEDEWRATLSSLEEQAAKALTCLEEFTELAPDFVRLKERVQTLAAMLRQFSAPKTHGMVRWVDVSQQLRLVESPLDIGETFRSKVLRHNAESHDDAPAKSWIFTSATLGSDETLSWFTRPCGLEDARIERVESPFDYAKQAALYLPRNFPKPSENTHSEAVARLALHGANLLAGRTLVLTTTLRALQEIGEQLSVQTPQHHLSILRQGQASKRELLAQFEREQGQNLILVASASFWEGVDIPGAALQLLIIDKLPFPPLGDPLVQARTEKLEKEGGNAFKDYHLAEAAVMLKQGAGRLIRRENDQGILVVCDPRLCTMSYGKNLLASLPRLARIENEEGFQAALRQLSLAYQVVEKV